MTLETRMTGGSSAVMQGICDHLRKQISSGSWPPEERLSQRLLAERYATTPLVMRRALYSLRDEGVIENCGGWRPTAADIPSMPRPTVHGPFHWDRDRNKDREIERILRRRIETGEYAPGMQLPTRAELAHEFAAPISTVLRAVTPLRKAGLLIVVAGGGTIVRDGDFNGTPQLSLPPLLGSKAEIANDIRQYIVQGGWRRGGLLTLDGLWEQFVGACGASCDLDLVLSHLKAEQLIEHWPTTGWRLDVVGSRWRPPGGHTLHDYIVRELRGRFHTGTYPAGEVLPVRDLAWAFSVPQSVFCRRPLQTLIDDGLLERTGFQGRTYRATGKADTVTRNS
ncbi:GntR family transcriptional regulator [Streptomyces sp. NPDC058391]|uniref:GntR family transcriptional regulator n=1 Tax=Streptomyces sp. NPDC058391 TaxID=3346476 RepID=UPI00365CBD76